LLPSLKIINARFSGGKFFSGTILYELEHLPAIADHNSTTNDTGLEISINQDCPVDLQAGFSETGLRFKTDHGL
jgi:hypothetical protein